MVRALALAAMLGGAWLIYRATRPLPSSDFGAGIREADDARSVIDSLLAGGEAVGTYFMNMAAPRGIRNNNPGNLRPGSQWKGLATPSIDSGNFLIFISPYWGIRALTIDLLNKQKRGLNTIRKIINVYAPPVENNTTAYIAAIARATNTGADEGIDLAANYGKLYNFVTGIISHENGQMPYTEQQIREGIDAGLSGVSSK